MIAEISAIVARGMGVRRGGRWLLRPVDIDVSAGVVGLAGQTGAGKSTLLATIATLRRPHVGELGVLGYDTGNADELRSARARIGYLPDQFYWAGNLTVREFVTYAAYYKRASQAAVRNALRRMDLKETASTELALLPEDVRLRAGLAATCVNEPDLVLLDEPRTAPRGPDPAAGTLGAGDAAAEELTSLIRTLAPTVLVTAAAAEHLTGWCDRVLTLARGRLTELPTRPVPPAAPPSWPARRAPSEAPAAAPAEGGAARLLAGV